MDPRLRGDDEETGAHCFLFSYLLEPKQLSMSSVKSYFVYILASKPNGTLYTGVTSNLIARIWQHKNNIVEGFTQQYQVHRLVYFEEHHAPNDAILREKQIKKWNRSWKIKLIEEKNPEWKDLWEDVSAF